MKSIISALTIFSLLTSPWIVQGVPPLDITPQEEGFFTESDRYPSMYGESIEEERARRAEEQAHPSADQVEGVPAFEVTPQQEGFFTESDRYPSLYGQSIEEEMDARRQQQEAGRLPPPAPPKGKKDDKKEDPDCLPYPCGNRWLLAGPAALVIGGGIGAGYAAGCAKSSWTRDISVSPCTDCHPKSKEVATLTLLEPFMNGQLSGEGVVVVQIFNPFGQLVAEAEMEEGMMPPALPSLEHAPSGNYLVSFTWVGNSVAVNPGGYLGGIEVNGAPVLPNVIDAGTTVNNGEQTHAIFTYPTS